MSDTESGPYTPAPWAPDFAKTAESIYEAPITEARGKAAQASEGEQQAISRRGAAVKEAIGAYREQRKAWRVPPPIQQVSAPPSRQLNDFLAPVENQPPAQTVMQMIAALTTLGTAIGGLAKGDARAALASLTGAMTGWQQGQKDRADRAFADWQANTDALLKNAQLRRQHYLDIMENTKLTNAETLGEVHLSALEYGDDVMAAAAAKRDANDVIAQLMKDREHIDSVQLRRDQMAQSYELGVARILEQQARDKMMAEQRALDRAERARESDQRYSELVREFDAKKSADRDLTPEAIEFAGQKYYQTGVMPQMGWGAQARIPIANAAARIAKEAGTTGTEWVDRTANYQALSKELTRLTTQRGPLLAFAQQGHDHLNVARSLVDKVGTTGVPVLTRWLRAGQTAILGDPDVTTFNNEIKLAVFEVARVTQSATGSGVATDSARRDASELLNNAMNPEQWKAGAASLDRALDFRKKEIEDRINITRQQIKELDQPAGASSGTSSAPPPKPGMIRVREKSSGRPGWIEESEMSELYEALR